MNENDWIHGLARKAYEAYCESTGWKSADNWPDILPDLRWNDNPVEVEITITKKCAETG